MNDDRILTPGNLVLAVLLAAILTGAHHLDTTWGAPELTQAQRDGIAAAKAERRREVAARDLCQEIYGPQTAHHWTWDGALTCITARGEQHAATTHAGVRP